jgi:ATP-dependent Clp protease ATP-binding subunit ClpB
VTETTKIEVVERLKQSVRPEFLNRIDEIVMFRPLMKTQIRQIVSLQLGNLEQLLSQKDIKLDISDSALDWLGDEGFDPQYGARPLKRTIQKEIVNAISKMLLAGEVNAGQEIKITAKNGELLFKTEVPKSPKGA